jgi:copper chaperone CopZ
VCAHAVRVAIRKLPGVESVDVSLERAMTDVRLKANNTVTLSQLRRVIKSGGFNAKEATVTAVGTLSEQGGKPAVNVSIINTVWLILPDSARRSAYEQVVRRVGSRQSQGIEITGVIQEPKDTGAPDQIAVHNVVDPK